MAASVSCVLQREFQFLPLYREEISRFLNKKQKSYTPHLRPSASALVVLWRQSCCYGKCLLPVPGRCASLDDAVDPCASVAFLQTHRIRLPLRPLQRDRSIRCRCCYNFCRRMSHAYGGRPTSRVTIGTRLASREERNVSAKTPSEAIPAFISNDGVSYLRNPDTGSEIWLVGVVHGKETSVEVNGTVDTVVNNSC